MVKRGRRKAIDPAQAAKYFRVARALHRSAVDLMEIADDASSYGNAVAVIAIHSAIAYADALTIAYGGIKSTEGEHERAADALKEALGARADADQVRRFVSIIRDKDTSYRGAYYTMEDAGALAATLREFSDWAERMYRLRP